MLLGPLLEMLTRTIQQFARLNRLVDDLLDVSRAQADQLALRMERADLRVIVKEVADIQMQAEPGRAFAVMLPADAIPVIADADRVGQVVTNYLTNALKYAPGEKPIEVGLLVLERPESGPATGQSHGWAQVWVRDYGPGIPAAEQELLWERFYRVQGIAAQHGSQIGLGLGLHISRTIIERHGGRVGLESEQGKGARFWFNLPLAAASDLGILPAPF
jgi:signal transduction histidine kinase